jgi:hypothetical protein
VRRDHRRWTKTTAVDRVKCAIVVACLVVLSGLPAMLVACNDSPSESKTYTDATYGYAFDYPATWQIKEGDTADISTGETAAGSVGVFDPKGTVVDDTYIDMAQISVYKLGTVVDKETLPQIGTEVEEVLKSLESQAGNLKTVEPLAETKAGDINGYKVTYSFTKSNASAVSTLYFLFSGDTEYQITVQSADGTWEDNQKVFKKLLSSFKAPSGK